MTTPGIWFSFSIILGPCFVLAAESEAGRSGQHRCP